MILDKILSMIFCKNQYMYNYKYFYSLQYIFQNKTLCRYLYIFLYSLLYKILCKYYHNPDSNCLYKEILDYNPLGFLLMVALPLL